MTASGCTYSAAIGCKVHQADHGLAKQTRIELDTALTHATVKLGIGLREANGTIARSISEAVQWLAKAQRALAVADRHAVRREQELLALRTA